MLKLGATGEDVRTLQRLINETPALGLRLTLDGHYGPATQAAVRAAQQHYGLVIDGIAGPKTLAVLRRGARDPRLLDDLELLFAAQDLGVPLATMRAVNEIESRGNGLLPDGRPVILFERHIMHRRLAARGYTAPQLAQLNARHPDIINPVRGGYIGGVGEHARLHAAAQIDPDAAIESASWGLYQIMGFHWAALGYPSAARWAQIMALSEGYQLKAFVKFIEAHPPMHTALREQRWATFARLYNGPAYRENLYDVKLARAYARHAATPAA